MIKSKSPSTLKPDKHRMNLYNLRKNCEILQARVEQLTAKNLINLQDLKKEQLPRNKTRCSLSLTSTVSIVQRSNLSISKMTFTNFPEPCHICNTFPCKCLTLENIQDMLNQNTKKLKEHLYKSHKSHDYPP